ncbi:MAG: hypothetical protein ACFFA0_13890 [Promethearchaeota archaeon]
MSIEADEVKKKSNKKRLDKFFGKDKANAIIECLEDCVNQGKTGSELKECVKECLMTQKGFDERSADDSVTIMAFITVG